MATLQIGANDDGKDATRGRMFIPHGQGREKSFRPHTQYLDVRYSSTGLDWNSRIRTIQQPQPKVRDTIFFPPLASLRRSNHRNQRSNEEYMIYPGNKLGAERPGRRTRFGEHHLNSLQTVTEYSVENMIGHRAVKLHSRNGIGVASMGDKPYQAVEYSKDFHKLLSLKVRAGKLPNVKHRRTWSSQSVRTMKSFAQLEMERAYEEEIASVKKLESWKPAEPLKSTIRIS